MDLNPAGIVGLGAVGGTIAEAFAEAGIPTRSYDRYLRVGRPEDLGGCPVVFVCVPTPTGPDGGLDIAEVWSAVEEVAPNLEPGAVIAVKSTVPPGTCLRLAEAFPRLEFASVPEFLVQARRLETFKQPDRILVGARSPGVVATVTAYLSLVAAGAPVIALEPTEAELVKLCSNAMLTAKVLMANELAEVCGRFGVAWPRVQAAVGLDRRIGPDHLSVTAERGVAGGCFPKDLDGLIAASRASGYVPPVLEELARFNRSIRSASGAEATHGDALLGAPAEP